MKKSPLKGADQTLVQGAYRAAMAGHGRGQDAMSEGMDAITEQAMKGVAAIQANRKEKRKEGDDLAKRIDAMNGSMGTNFFDASQEYVKGLHDQYDKDAKWGRKNKTAEGMGSLNAFSLETASAKETREAIKDAQLDSDWSNSASSKELSIFNAVMNEETPTRVTKDGKWEIDIGDGKYMLMSDVENMMQEHKKDYATMTDIRQQAIDVAEKGKADAKRNKEEGYTGGGYDVTKATAKMDNTLRNANLKSLMHDDVLENNKPWAIAVEENPEITGMTYEELGLPTPKGDDGIIGNEDDPQGAQTVLSGEHRGLIVDALINPDNDLYDEERTRGMMASYFTGFVNTQYNNEYDAGGGKYTSDSKGQFGETAQEQADNFMKEKGIK